MEEHILVIEDNIADIEAIKRILKKHTSALAHFCQCGSDALALLNNDTPLAKKIRLILLDLNMPGMDGIKFLQKLQALEPDIPVVIFTTSNNQTDIQECYKHGAKSYLLKPVSYKKFTDCIASTVHYWTNLNVMSTT